MSFTEPNQDFDPENHSFSDFEQCPQQAILLWYLNAGLDVSEWISRLPDKHAERKLEKEIKSHLLKETEMEQITKEFHVSQGLANASPIVKGFSPSVVSHLVSCGSCGIRIPEKGNMSYSEVSIEQIVSLLELKDERLEEYNRLVASSPISIPIDGDFNLKSINVQDIMSVYKSPHSGKLFNLHPELVHIHPENGESTMMCKPCYESFVKKKIIPKNSIAGGIDHGDTDRIGLTDLNVIERMLIAQVRVYQSIIKIRKKVQSKDLLSGSRMHGHAIMFPHDSPQAVSFAVMLEMLSKMDKNLKKETMTSFCNESVVIQFLSQEDTIDYMIEKTFGTHQFNARAYVIQQWLMVLQKTSNAGYMTDPPIEHIPDLQETISDMNTYIRDNAQKVTEEDIINSQDSIADGPNSSAQNCNNGLGLSYSFVRSQSGKQHQEDPITDRMKTLLSVAESCNVSVKDKHKYSWISHRSNDPINKFAENDNNLQKAFPNVFPLGTTYTKKPSLLPHEIKHLLLQFNCKAARCRELLFFLFDEQECKKNIIGVSQAVKSGKLEAFSHLNNSEEFKQKLQKAITDPTSCHAMHVIKEVLPILNLSKPISDFGPGARMSSISKQIACHRRYGPAATFVTIAPNLQEQPTALRMTFRSVDNMSFPCTIDDSFFEAVRKNSKFVGTGNIQIPLGYQQRARQASNNPVAMALAYEKLISDTLEILFGVPPDKYTTGQGKKSVRTTYFRFRKKGIFGHLVAHFGSHETQNRGTLHFHLILYGGITPEILDAVAGMEGLCKIIAEALDKLYKAEIPPSFHLTRIIKNYKQTDEELRDLLSKNQPEINNPIHHNAPSPQKRKHWEAFAAKTIAQCGVHRHSFTCHKGCTQKRQCREAYKQRPVQHTRPILLKPHSPEIYQTLKLQQSEHPPEICHMIPARKRNRDRDTFKEPLPTPENDRCLYWEIQRRQLPLLSDLTHYEANNENKQLCVDEIKNILLSSKKLILMEMQMKNEQWLIGLKNKAVNALY